MAIQQLLTNKTQQLDEEIRQYIIEIRKKLPELGYVLKTVYKEARRGMIFCAAYELPSVNPAAVLGLAYLRVSKDLQSDNNSLVTQVLQILALARERDITITRFYVDAGITGADSRRPAFQGAMRAAPNGKYCSLYTYDLYRFYRGLRGLANNYHILMDNNVDLVSVAAKDTDLSSRDGKILVYLRGIMGELYLDDLSRTVTDNKLKRALDGHSNASISPFGYCRGRCFQCTDNNGEGYCPHFGSRDDLWRELDDDPKVFVPHPIDQHAFQVAIELHVTGRFSDADIARRLNPPYPDEMERLISASRTTVKPVEKDRAIVLLQNGSFALQHADGALQFFRPKGQPGRADPNRRFTADSIRDMLQNPYYAGFVVYRKQKKRKGKRKQVHKRFKTPLTEMARRQRDGALLNGDHGMLFPGEHIPLITVDLYEQSQRVRGLKGHNPTNATRTRRTYPLSGVLKCEHCKGPFRGNAGNGNIRYYEDARRAGGASNCPVRSFRAEKAEEEVFAYVQHLYIPDEWHTDILAYLRQAPEWDDLRRQRRAVQTRLSAAREMLKQEILSHGEFRELERECSLRLGKLERDVQTSDAHHEALLRDFPRLWAAATDEERKGLLRCTFSAIWVKDGTITAYEPRDPFAALLPNHASTLTAGDVHGQAE